MVGPLATDPDSGDTLTYSAEVLYSGLRVSPPFDFISFDASTRTFTFAPTLGDVGESYTIFYQVTDDNSVSASGGTIMTEISFDVSISAINYPPVFSSAVTSAIEVDEGDSVVEYLPSFTDADGSDLHS